jgi:hypothetical protein
MSTPLGENTLATGRPLAVPFDNLAADLDAGNEGFEGGRRHGTARHLLTPPLECLVEPWGVETVQPDQLIGHDDGVAVDDLGDEAAGAARPPLTHYPVTLSARTIGVVRWNISATAAF